VRQSRALPSSRLHSTKAHRSLHRSRTVRPKLRPSQPNDATSFVIEYSAGCPPFVLFKGWRPPGLNSCLYQSSPHLALDNSSKFSCYSSTP